MNRRSSTKRALQVLGLILGLLVASPGRYYAQDATARIIGTVTDPQGAVVAGATVQVTNSATKVINKVVTTKDGTYEALALPIGTYRVSVEQPGFKKSLSSPVTLEINQVARVEVKLEVGQVSEVVEVSSGATVVETVNATLGESITSRPLVDLPLNGRNPLDLALLLPGVMTHNPDDTSAGTFNIAGGRSDSVTFLLDGGNNNNLLNNGAVYIPNPDAIAEFRILTSNYTAEYGRNGGGIISIVTKSGTNQLHGSGFDFLRNDALNANSFFNNLNGLQRDVLKRNQFGGTLGGPIYIPKVVDGREKFFWFFSYQGQRQTAQTPSSTTTFTPAELTGDFSHSFNGGPDPNVAAFLQANPFFQPNPGLAAQAVIAPGRINPTAQKYISNNLIPTSNGPNGLLASQGSSLNNNNDIDIRLDFNVTANDRISATLASITNPVVRPFSQANVPGYPVTDNNAAKFLNISYTKTFSPAVLNEFRFTTQRANRVQSVPATSLPTPSQLGIGITPDNPTGPSGLGFASGLSTGFSVQGPTALINNTFAYSDTLSWIKGRHNMKFGGYFSNYQNNTVFDFFVDGVFFFDGPPELGGIGSGNDRADFLFGLPDFYLQFGAAPSNIRSRSTYGFAQDEFRVSKKLTVTLGLRYEYNSPKLDTQGRSFSLQPGAHSQRFPNAPTGLTFPGDPGAPTGANFPDRNDFAPRVGFAWDPWGNGKTSIRGGFGVFYDILKGEDNLQYNGQAPFFGFAALFFNPPTGPISANVNIFSDPFGNAGVPNSFPSKPPAKNINFGDSGFLPFGGGGVFFVDPHLRTPYVYQYNLSVERELSNNLKLELNYVGSTAHKLTTLVDANPFIKGTNTRVLNAVPGGNFSFLDEFQNVGNANYNSLEVNLTKGFSNTRYLGNTYFIASYTLAHSIDNTSGFRNRNSEVPAYQPGLFRSNSDFDVRHRFSFGGIWDLPFARLWDKGPKRLLDGWRLSPIISYQTGFPLDVFAGFSASTSNPGPSGVGDRNIVHANLVGTSVTTFNPKNPQNLGGTTGQFFFNPASFNNNFPSGSQVAANPALATYGTLPRNFFRGPGRTNFDLSLAKTTNIYKEQLKLEIRLEAFNVFNTVQFLNPDTSITSGTFGQILGTNPPRIVQVAAKFTF